MRLSIISLLIINFFAVADSVLKLALEESLDELMPKVIEWRHDIHQHPELAIREFRTSKKVADHLISLGLEVETGVAYTGVVALIEGGSPGPTVAVRADMDALPVTEKTGLPFASTVRTTYLGNDVGVMHACGHDAHVSILMGVAEFLVKNKDKLKGNVLLIFQPAEEGPPEDEGGGAKMMLEEGIFERYNPEALAAASAYRITIKGVQTHGSTPWSGIDPIMATSQLIEALNTIVSRRINIINYPAVVSVGMVDAGTRNNIIPYEAMLMGTIRTYDPELRKEIYEEIEQIARGIAVGTGTEVKVEFDVGGFYPVTVNDKDLTAKLQSSLMEASQGKFVLLEAPATGAEDFSYFSREIPGVFFWLGVNKPGVGLDSTNFGASSEAAPNHSPYFFVHDDALDEGVRGLTYLVADYLSSE